MGSGSLKVGTDMALEIGDVSRCDLPYHKEIVMEKTSLDGIAEYAHKDKARDPDN